MRVLFNHEFIFPNGLKYKLIDLLVPPDELELFKLMVQNDGIVPRNLNRYLPDEICLLYLNYNKIPPEFESIVKQFETWKKEELPNLITAISLFHRILVQRHTDFKLSGNMMYLFHVYEQLPVYKHSIFFALILKYYNRNNNNIQDNVTIIKPFKTNRKPKKKSTNGIEIGKLFSKFLIETKEKYIWYLEERTNPSKDKQIYTKSTIYEIWLEWLKEDVIINQKMAKILNKFLKIYFFNEEDAVVVSKSLKRSVDASVRLDLRLVLELRKE